MNQESIILDPSNANFPFQFFQNHYAVLRRAYLDINTNTEADGEQSFCKGMWILESRKFWLWNSESGKKCLTVESGIQLKESVFPLKRWESRILGAVYMEGERS